MKHLITTFTLWLLFSLLSWGQTRVTATVPDTLRRKPVHQLGIDLFPGYVLPTHRFFRGDNAVGKPVRSTFSAHLKYAFRFGEDTYFGRNYPHTYQGIGVAYNTFSNSSEIGNPLALYVFQRARIVPLAPRLSLDYEWNFGASFGWKKYDEVANPYNQVVGSPVNAYINLGFLLNWKIASGWSLLAGVGVTHFSNGNTRYPNSGVNSVGPRVGIVHAWGDEGRHGRSLSAGADRFAPYVSYDLVLYGATRKKGFLTDTEPVKAILASGSFGILGLNFNPMYNFSRYFRAGVSLDAQYDESANIKNHIAGDVTEAGSDEDVRFYRPSFREQFGVGISLRGELVMPVFSINVGIGKNFICKGGDLDKFYQVFALKTHLSRRFFLHVGYQLYKFKEPNNLMLGIGYRFRGR